MVTVVWIQPKNAHIAKNSVPLPMENLLPKQGKITMNWLPLSTISKIV